ncbi:pyruvate formate lyase family protein [Klebsiella pneumoniae]
MDFDTNVATSITAHAAGYIKTSHSEKIVACQTDQPLKRALHPFGGIKMIKSAFEAYGREMDPDFEYQFTALVKPTMRGPLTSVPDMLALPQIRGAGPGYRTAMAADGSWRLPPRGAVRHSLPGPRT